MEQKKSFYLLIIAQNVLNNIIQFNLNYKWEIVKSFSENKNVRRHSS